MNETSEQPEKVLKKKVEPEKVKKPKKDTKKIVLIVLGSVFGVGIVAALLYFFVFRDTTPPLSDAEYLVQVGTWEKSDSSKVKWIFKENGKGTLTTNDAQNFYDFTWELDKGSLKISTAWLYSLEDEFTFSLNREENSFTVVSKDDEKESTFVPTVAESAEPEQLEQSGQGEA